ncbi:neural cell adhesion molecule L1-like protein [Pomacea canaliculata]|uniref:neural cell adhesion molecule L1-like protein n=1 Tax=Pomacea canaliculata TaxID=400727 RepID=UPI000D72E4F0|nr:neural cell adhesion molecule L1-like protein [Pomacea canaliculata]XP_025090627.1 neural cell adhesion molecule L1-like protein [Pomacea canaliculata]XP_025090629.1 neural cell adhesion molecule L1-like protein [Pomacea canaliculata]XP_025090630.1 neural cell adhesion molecule L1-like protein [Pomacea canaliculata]XP_025090631.1 neural cell adhesion molecule L1-like protein [Pomacea canaliculata]XP_025090632.1 neural cell adhesion molecule L1-like protein [Pomacea canaliculata]
MAWMVSTILQLLFVLGTLELSGADETRVPPSILSPTERQELVYVDKEKVEVRCSATGQPTPVYKWLWNENEIQSEYITFSESTGILTIPNLSTREEGLFLCHASNTFSNGRTATAVSAALEIRVGRIEDFLSRPLEPYYGIEGNYVRIPCDKDLPVYYGAVTFKWYTVIGSVNDEVRLNERTFIDQGGNLHFSYVLKSDEKTGDTLYKCAISSAKGGTIKLGNGNSLNVTSTAPIANSKPRLMYNTSGSFLTVEVGNNARLECVFSGYTEAETVPRILWYDQDGQAITQGGRYDITANGRTLIIKNVTEDDEKTYRCKGINSLGSDEGSMALNITSPPIWVQPVKSTTVVEGNDAMFTCTTRSAKGEQKPSPPLWALNAKQMGSVYDPNKYQFNADKTTLTVKSVNKDTDIACFQCTVANSVGMVKDDGCINVIKPIEIKVRPAAQQSVMKGDKVDLTVVATTDPLYAPDMTYSWIFNNVNYTGDKAPPYVTYDIVNKLAYINTSELTDEEFKSIGGLYRRAISHPVQTVYVDVTVETKLAAAVGEVATASFSYWIIGLIIGIIILITVILFIVCVICRRKMQEATYPVDKKETAAGLDPEKELKSSGFHDLSRVDFDEYPTKRPQHDLDFNAIPVGEGDDENFAEYGGEPSKFNEDGSFIGTYSKDMEKVPLRQSNSTESLV